MNTKHISLAFALLTAAALLAGCEKNPLSGRQANLELSSVSTNETKAVIDGTIFPKDGHIGLFLFKDESAVTPYGDAGCSNVEYSYNGDTGKWTANSPITVGGEPGHLYGYYPYNSSVTDIKSIPVASSLDGDDVMYATKQTVTDETASQTAIKMNHALARVTITVVNNGYTLGGAELSSIKFSGAEISLSGSLDATTGIISGTTKSDMILDIPSGKRSITAEGTVYECLLVPSKVEPLKQTLDLTLQIDGNDKTTTLSGDDGIIIAQNARTNVTIALSNSGISVQTVSIEDWNVVEVGGHKVTVKRSSEDGIADDVFLDVTSNGSAVTIKTLSATGRFTQCTCTPAGKATCNPSIDAATGICTFTITNVQDDITAEVSYLKCNVTVEYDSDMGSVKLNGTAVASGTPVQILYGEEAVFTAEANTGYGLIKWTDGSDKDLSTDNPFTISKMTSDITLNAVFGYRITAEAKPAGAGTVTGAGIYLKGSSITLRATAGGSGTEFVGWAKAESPGTIISKNNPYEFAVSQSASYVAVFKLKDALSGVFTVAADDQGNPTKKVQFSKGNLYCSGVEFNEDGTVKSIANAQWGFEANQYDTTPSSDGNRVDNHISHFMWCADATNAMALKYNTGWCYDKKFFAGENFTVNGYSGWRTLSTNEWKYLFNTRTVNGGQGAGKSYSLNITYGGKKGLVLYPDDYDKDPVTGTVTDLPDGVVFLPAAGYRIGYNGNEYVKNVGLFGYYWSASPGDGGNFAFGLVFGSGSVDPLRHDDRHSAQSVRLVTESK